MKTKNNYFFKAFLLKINYKFNDTDLLSLSLTHSSIDEKKIINNYQRLEFLGDRVLGLIIAQLIFEKFPLEKEGQLSKRFADLVNKKTLVKIAKDINLAKLIKTTKESGLKIEITKSMLADCLEAIIGAIFLDSDFSTVKKVIEGLWREVINNQTFPPENPKSILQEWCLKNKKNLPMYETLDKIGPDHEPLFLVQLIIKNFIKIDSSGSTKQEAEINAANLVIKKISNDKRIK